MNDDFPRIKRLPAYVFAVTNELKAKARSRGEDIIDFGMGNPDQPTPKQRDIQHISIHTVTDSKTRNQDAAIYRKL